ncbi:MAG: CaiB/BaiF CoA transferase family protein [Gammaproteobacteria bacterium]
MTTGTLQGIRVVEVAIWVFVPAAGAVLADWGADVVKVEHPQTGDPVRGLITSGRMPGVVGGLNYMFEQANRGKRSVALDIATPRGRELLYTLVRNADVFLTNFLPGARRRLGIEPEDIRRVNPRIIYARGSGQGAAGAEADRPGYDFTSFWARGAVAEAVTPPESAYPVGQPPAFGDFTSGMSLAGGIAAALLRRERTGEASVVDVSLLGQALWAMSPGVVASKLYGETGSVRFDRLDSPNPLVHCYRTRDDRFVFLNVLEDEGHWVDLCAHLERPALAQDPRFGSARLRTENKAACVQALDEAFAARTLQEWLARLATLKGAWAPVRNVRDVHEDPQVIANGLLPNVQVPGRPDITLVGSPVQIDRQPTPARPAPEHGQHTEEVLLELGCTWEDIGEFKTQGVIA